MRWYSPTKGDLSGEVSGRRIKPAPDTERQNKATLPLNSHIPQHALLAVQRQTLPMGYAKLSWMDYGWSVWRNLRHIFFNQRKVILYLGKKKKKNHSEAETNQSNQSFRTKLPPCSQPQPRSGQPANSPANNSPAVRTKRRCGGSSAWPLEGSLAPLFSSLLLPAVILPLDAHALCRALSDSPLLFPPFQLGRRSLADSKRDTFPGRETVCFFSCSFPRLSTLVLLIFRTVLCYNLLGFFSPQNSYRLSDHCYDLQTITITVLHP